MTIDLDLRQDPGAGISEAVGAVERELSKHVSDIGAVMPRLVFCEEMMLVYADAGYTRMRIVLKKRFRYHYLTLAVPGERMDILSDASGGDPSDDMTRSIRRKVLESGKAWSDQRYIGGENRIRVLFSDQERVLTENITELYAEKGTVIRDKPLRLIREIVRRDPVRMIGTVVNRIVKRACLLAVPVCSAALIDRIVRGEPFFSPITLGLVVLALALVSVNCICNGIFDRFLFSRKLREIEMALKEALLHKLRFMDASEAEKLPSGGVLSKIIKDTENVRGMLSDAVSVGVQFLTDMVMIVVMALMNCPVMLAFYLVTVPLTVLLVHFFRGRIMENAGNLRRSSEKAGGVIRDMQDMRSLTRVHGIFNAEYQILDLQLTRVKQAEDEYDRVNHRFNTMTTLTFQSFQILSLAFAVYLASRGTISIGLVVMFQSYFESMVNSVTKVIDAIPAITHGYESLISINEILCMEQTEKNGTKRLPGPLRGEIEFRDVVFSYDDAVPPVIDHLSFRIPAGKSAAFVGDSGAGKTTIMNLITGVLHRQGGEILIDGVDVDDLEKVGYRRQIASVPQNTVLFSGTLWDNLTYGQNYVSSEEVFSVIEQVGFSDVIRSLPDGLSTRVQESGSNFSGGQRQRLAIIRALLRKPRLLLFDEATSALDGASERQVQEAIEHMMGRCTVVMIAHRLTTVRKCDMIIRVGRRGTAVYGSFDEFMRGEGEYT